MPLGRQSGSGALVQQDRLRSPRRSVAYSLTSSLHGLSLGSVLHIPHFDIALGSALRLIYRLGVGPASIGY